jgi:hypothetical protein
MGIAIRLPGGVSTDRAIELGNMLLGYAGAASCEAGYGTTDPEWVGRYGLEYGDINLDGTVN